MFVKKKKFTQLVGNINFIMLKILKFFNKIIVFFIFINTYLISILKIIFKNNYCWIIILIELKLNILANSIIINWELIFINNYFCFNHLQLNNSCIINWKYFNTIKKILFLYIKFKFINKIFKNIFYIILKSYFSKIFLLFDLINSNLTNNNLFIKFKYCLCFNN